MDGCFPFYYAPGSFLSQNFRHFDPTLAGPILDQVEPSGILLNPSDSPACVVSESDSLTTGDPSSSCEMIILHNNSHGGIIRVCMGIFTTALRNKKYVKFSKKIPHLASTAYCLLSDRLLWWKEPIWASCSFRGFQRTFWSKLRLSVGCTGKIEFVVNWNETTVYVLGFCVGFVAARSFWAWIFRFSDQAFGNGVFSLGLFLCTLKTSKWTTR